MTVLSIIMPVFNDEDFLDDAINSVLAQTIEDFELICINDCSTDDSLDILNQFAKKDSRIIPLSLNQNSGSGACRNKGLELAKGEFIAFLDSDDYLIDKTAYEVLISEAKEKNVDMICPNMQIFTDNEYIYENENFFRVTENKMRKPEEYGVPWYFCRNIFKKDFLSRNDIKFPDLKRGQDTVFMTKVLTNLTQYYEYNIELYLYRYIWSPNKYGTFEKYIANFNSFYLVFRDLLSNKNFNNVVDKFYPRLVETKKYDIPIESKEELLELNYTLDKLFDLFMFRKDIQIELKDSFKIIKQKAKSTYYQSKVNKPIMCSIDDLNEKNEIINKLKLDLSNLQKINYHTKSYLLTLESEISRLKNNSSDSSNCNKNSLNVSEEYIVELKKVINDQKEKTSSLEVKVSEERDDFAMLNAEIKILNEELNNKSFIIQNKDKEILNLKNKIKEKDNNIHSLIDKNYKQEMKLKKLLN